EVNQVEMPDGVHGRAETRSEDGSQCHNRIGFAKQSEPPVTDAACVGPLDSKTGADPGNVGYVGVTAGRSACGAPIPPSGASGGRQAPTIPPAGRAKFFVPVVLPSFAPGGRANRGVA